MISKKKIVAIVLFILMGFIMFTFANPSDGIRPTKGNETKPEEKETKTNEDTPLVVDLAPTINIDGMANNSVVYDELPELKAICRDDHDGVLTGDRCKVTHDIDNKKVGKYTVTVTATDSVNHKTVKTYEYEVKKREVELVIDDVTITYGETAELTYSIKDAKDTYLEEYPLNVVLTAEGCEEEVCNAGTYDITYVSSDDDNYEIVEKNTGKLTIEKADFVPAEHGVTFKGYKGVYDNKTHYVRVKGLPKGIFVTYENNHKREVGTRTATATFTYSENYNPTTMTAEIEITPKKVKVVIDNKASKYGEKIVKLTHQTVKGVYSNDNLNIKLSTTATATSNVGKYPITGTYNNKNYDVEFVNGTYTINKAKFDPSKFNVTFEPYFGTYDGKTHTILVKGLPSNVEVTYKNNTKKNVGFKAATATFTYSENYETYTMYSSLTVYTRLATVIVDDKTSVYGEELKELTYKAYNVVNNDNLNVNLFTTIGKNKNAGTYVIGATAFNSNYIITVIPGKYVIEKATLNPELLGIKFEDVTVTYDGRNHASDLKVTGVNSRNVSINVKNAVNAGTYNATATVTVDNYKPATLNATLTINKKDVTVTANNKQIEYGTTVTLDGTNTALVGRDRVNVTYAVEGTTPINELVVGTYNIIPTVTNESSLNNYNIIKVNGTLTVTSAAVSLQFNDVTATYDGESHSLAVEGILPLGVTVAYEYNNETTNSFAKVDAGTYNVTAKFTVDTTRYSAIEDMTATLTINRAQINVANVTFEDKTVTYNGNSVSVTANNIPVLVTAAYTNNTHTNAGVYTATLVLSTDDNHELVGNYDNTAILTIEKATLVAPEVGTLTATEGDNLSDVELPEGFTLVTEDKELTVPSDQTTATEEVVLNYCPAGTNTDNYVCPNVDATVVVNALTYRVNFYDAIDSTEASSFIDVRRSSKVTLPEEPTKKNYTFSKWVDVNGNEVTNNTVVNSNMDVYATYTANVIGITVEEAPNAQFRYTRSDTPSQAIKEQLVVKAIYADQTNKTLTADEYTTDFDITHVATDKVLTVSYKTFTDKTIKYTVTEKVEFQHKVRVTWKENTYRKTKKNGSCDENCDSIQNTEVVNAKGKFLEITEAYIEFIKVTKVNVVYTNNKSEKLEISKRVRYSYAMSDGYVNPVYLAAKDIKGRNDEKPTVNKNVANNIDEIKTIDVYYTRTFTKTVPHHFIVSWETEETYTNDFVVRFEGYKEENGELVFKPVSETQLTFNK